MDKKFLRNVPLPEGLKGEEIYQVLLETQNLMAFIREKTGINLSSIIQANNFSGMISNIFTQKLSECSSFKKLDDQKFPDLKSSEGIGLEIKASNKPWKWAEGHNGHAGWHLIVCYTVLADGNIDFIQAEIAFLNGFESSIPDWKYCGSKRNQNASQRTETYLTTNTGTFKLRDGSVYLDEEKVKISAQLKKARKEAAILLPIPPFSPFFNL